MNSDITIIIVTYNSEKIIPRLLDNFEKDNEDFKFIVVDNNSSDNTTNLIHNNYNFINLIKLNQNIGYGRANNIALKKCETKYALILNPDVIIDADEIIKLKDRLIENEGAIIAPDFSNESRSSPSSILKVDWVVGAAMMFDIERVSKIGFFDENIFLFFEETDLCKRVLDSNEKILLDCGIIAFHEEGGSSTKSKKIDDFKDWHFAWSKTYYDYKYSNKTLFLTNKLLTLAILYSKLLLNYTVKNDGKIDKYKFRISVLKAFLISKNAFRKDGNPKGMTE